eukprot:TRINITY_DN18755_c0_g1::TRINITY_DN18755_c0_g1_i1::g.15252::m.15252 TRINITY_DN18755_c0_g1::TRINITY_DN18755_c0_g1_i1::g.15252  ORF type:complete len:282 (-),score=18.97,sp/Q1ZXD9/Y8017_DICDI/26.47/2e-07,Exo_endo_phos/PF03372.18/5.2e-23,Exo_endo_phos_2/PF14529.1/4.3e+02,Exo_endo_phos_2/PF14529.1/0.36 TRINITY_DN18755_c0_g1_i1:79-924(-)
MLKIISINACLLPIGFVNSSIIGYDNQLPRIDKLMHFIQDYDIIILQEVWGTIYSHLIPNAVLKLADKYGFHHYVRPARSCLQMVDNGLMILSKYEIIDSDQLTFQSSSGLQWFIPNGVIYASVRLPTKKSLHVFCTHFHAGPRDSSLLNSDVTCKQVQRDQARELRAFMKEMMRHDPTGAFLLAGDFNSDALGNCPELLDFAELCHIMEMSSLLEHFRFPNTYPIPLEGGPLVNPAFVGVPTCLDHVFSNLPRAQIDVISVVYDNEYISDHAAIAVYVDI